MKTGLLTGILVMLLTQWAPAHADETVVAVGDSITHGGGTYDPERFNWPQQMGAEVIAVPGGCIVTEVCEGPLPSQGYRHDVLAEHPDVVILAYGMNDLIHSSAEEIVAGLKDLRRRNAKRGVATFVATLTPVGERVWGLDSHRVELNNLIRQRFAAWRIIDFSAALIGPDGRLPARYDSGDNLHPNARAYKKMAWTARRALRESHWATRVRP